MAEKIYLINDEELDEVTLKQLADEVDFEMNLDFEDDEIRRLAREDDEYSYIDSLEVY